MKNNKSHLVLIPAIGAISFMLSQWIAKSNQTDVFLGLSSDVLAGLVVGMGFGVMILILRQGILKNKDHCK